MAKRKTKLILNRVVSLVLFLATTIVLGKSILLGDKISIIVLLLMWAGIINRLWISERRGKKNKNE